MLHICQHLEPTCGVALWLPLSQPRISSLLVPELRGAESGREHLVLAIAGTLENMIWPFRINAHQLGVIAFGCDIPVGTKDLTGVPPGPRVMTLPPTVMAVVTVGIGIT